MQTDLTSAKDIFREGTAEKRLKELKAFLVEKGVRDFDKVPLYSEQLDKVSLSSLLFALLPSCDKPCADCSVNWD